MNIIAMIKEYIERYDGTVVIIEHAASFNESHKLEDIISWQEMIKENKKSLIKNIKLIIE